MQAASELVVGRRLGGRSNATSTVLMRYHNRKLELNSWTLLETGLSIQIVHSHISKYHRVNSRSYDYSTASACRLQDLKLWIAFTIISSRFIFSIAHIQMTYPDELRLMWEHFRVCHRTSLSHLPWSRSYPHHHRQQNTNLQALKLHYPSLFPTSPPQTSHVTTTSQHMEAWSPRSPYCIQHSLCCIRFDHVGHTI